MSANLITAVVVGVVVPWIITWLLKRKAKHIEAPERDMTFKAFKGALFSFVLFCFLEAFGVAMAIGSFFLDISWWIGPMFALFSVLMGWLCYVVFTSLKDKVVVGPEHLFIDGARVDTRTLNEWNKLIQSARRYTLDLQWKEIREIEMQNMVLYFTLTSGKTYSLSMGPYDSKMAPMISKFKEVRGLN